MNAANPDDNDDIPPEIDFSGGTRGKFHRPNARLNLPVYLDADVQAYLAALAAKKGVPLSDPRSREVKTRRPGALSGWSAR
jgi:hypothetical protein